MREKDEEIQSLRKKLDSLEQTIQTANSQLAHATQKSQNLENTLQQKEFELAECKKEMNSMVAGSLICTNSFCVCLIFLQMIVQGSGDGKTDLLQQKESEIANLKNELSSITNGKMS